MADFGLIHGGAHGAWCWDFVRLELQLLGHRVFTVDLPCEDVTKGAVASAQAAAEAFCDAAPDLIVVAHSYGGLVAPLVPVLRPARQVVFLCAGVPDIGRSLVDQFAEMDISYSENNAAFVLDELGRAVYPPEKAGQILWQDCSPEIARWAGVRLRPQSMLVASEITPLTAWPQVMYHSIIATEDRVTNGGTHRRIVAERLGISPRELPGSHSPFLSRPAHLAAMLDEITR